MPTYDYQCGECEWEESHDQKITEPPIEVCSQCGSYSLRRLISASGGFMLKGDGWYSSGYSSTKHEILESARGADPGTKEREYVSKHAEERKSSKGKK